MNVPAPITVALALRTGRELLPAAEAALLLQEILGWNRAQLIARDDTALSGAQAQAYRQALVRRAAGEPMAYIIGYREFFGRDFLVTPAVLIPRPETELLVELGLGHLSRCRLAAPRVLDLGTGSGILAITLALECPAARVMAVDRSAAALAVAEKNARRLGAGVEFAESDWFTSVSGRFDLIVANPPYIAPGDGHLERGDLRFEPGSALVAAEEGWADLRHIVTGAPRHLHPGAALYLEHGYDHAAGTRALLARGGFEAVASWQDLAGIERASGGVLAKEQGR